MSETIAGRLRKARKNVGLSTTRVSKMTGISEGNISEWENGHCNPTAKNLLLLSKAYNVSIDWLLTGKNKLTLENGGNKDIVLFLQEIYEDWERGDEAMRGWILIQLRKAFPELAERFKKDE